MLRLVKATKSNGQESPKFTTPLEPETASRYEDRGAWGRKQGLGRNVAEDRKKRRTGTNAVGEGCSRLSACKQRKSSSPKTRPLISPSGGTDQSDLPGLIKTRRCNVTSSSKVSPPLEYFQPFSVKSLLYCHYF